jgi:hypothetical protein
LPEQLALFAPDPPTPERLIYRNTFISPDNERELIAHVAALPLRPFQFGQFEGKRRVASFGFRYDDTLGRHVDAEPIPSWLGPLIEQVEAFGGPRTRIQQVLCSMMSASVSDGIATSRNMTGCSACRSVPPADCGSENPPRLDGGGSRSMPRHVLCHDRSIPTGMGAQHSRRRSAALFDHVAHAGG